MHRPPAYIPDSQDLHSGTRAAESRSESGGERRRASVRAVAEPQARRWGPGAPPSALLSPVAVTVHTCVMAVFSEAFTGCRARGRGLRVTGSVLSVACGGDTGPRPFPARTPTEARSGWTLCLSARAVGQRSQPHALRSLLSLLPGLPSRGAAWDARDRLCPSCI